MSATIRIEFITDHPLAMVTDWPRMLGLLGPLGPHDLKISDIDCEVIAGPGPEPTLGSDGLSPDLDESDAAQVHSRRVKEAIDREYKGDPFMPRIVVVIEYPKGNDPNHPEGRVAIASTGTDALDTHRMLALGIGAMKRATRDASRKN